MSGAQSDGPTARTLQALETVALRVEGLLHEVGLSPAVIEDEGFSLHDQEAQLRELRAAMPRRQLLMSEALRIAERQASLLRWQVGRAGTAALPTDAIVGLPFLTVTYRAELSKSALVTKTERGWVIVLCADEPAVRQRFSLCHEVKHLLDDPFTSQYSAGLYAGSGGSSGDRAERVSDYFAGCLLMPKMLLRRDWVNHLQDPARLAKRYNVSRAAMEVRLRQIGLTETVPRCGIETPSPTA